MDEGYSIIKVVFSKGELSHPHHKEEIVTKIRVKETEKTSKKFGISKTIYLGLKDRKLAEEIDNEKIHHKVIKLINKNNPEKILIPCEKDPHLDHRAVYFAMRDILKKAKYKGSIYSYEVWNLVKEEKPEIYIDITKYFQKKIQMMKSFKSQWHFMYPLIPLIYTKNKTYGLKINCKYAEKLYKLQ